MTLALKDSGLENGLDEAAVLAGIEEREKLGSTGFGRGVAIPHARIAGVNRPVAAFLAAEPLERGDIVIGHADHAG